MQIYKIVKYTYSHKWAWFIIIIIYFFGIYRFIKIGKNYISIFNNLCLIV